MTLDDLDEVPDSTAASNTGGAPRLDADPIDDSQLSQIDALLDDAEAKAEGATRDVSPPAVEPTPDPVATPDPVEQVTPAAPTLPPLDPAVEGIESPRNLSEKNQSNWRRLQEVGHNAIARVRELEAQLANAPKTGEVQTPPDYEELRKFRATFDIKNDPDFKSKYDAPIQSSSEAIYGILKKNGATDELIDSMKALGGPEKVDQNWWTENALAKLPFMDAEKLKANLLGVSELRDKQQKEIEDAGNNAEQFFAQKEEKSKEWYSTETKEIESTLDGITKDIPWARFQRAPENATPEQIERVQKHNEAVNDLRQKFNSCLWPQTAKERTAIATAATFSHVLTQQLRIEQGQRESIQKELKQAQDELSKLKSASKVPRSNAAAASNNKPQQTSRINMSAGEAFDAAMAELGE